MENSFVKKWVPLVAVSLISGILGGFIAEGLGRNDERSNGPSKIIEERAYVEESKSTKAIEKVAPTVISIVASKDLQVFKQNSFNPFNDPFFQQIPGFQFQFPKQQQPGEQSESETRRQRVSGGTGFIIRSDGLAVTNKHVVIDEEADYTAIFPDGKEFDVEILSKDPLNDLAVVQLHKKNKDNENRKSGEKIIFFGKPENLPVVELGNSDTLKVGQKVFAIGYARGDYENSVTAGIVSAIGREITAGDQGGGFQETLLGLIQTDAAINFGNSGGPLVNLAGQVIGVNTAVDSAAQGIGFAIPAVEVKTVLASLDKNGKIIRPMLGIRHIILNKERAEQYGLKGVEYGALITGDRTKGEIPVIPGSAAAKAGLKMDDVILEVDGEKITEKNSLLGMVRKHQVGDTLILKVWRDGKTREVKVKLEEVKTGA